MSLFKSWTQLPSSIITILTAILLIPSADAQQATVLVASQLPACALQCPVLKVAQDQCVPPFRPTTSQQVYNACFCNSDYLTAFKAGQVQGFCQGYCTTDEANAILTWLRGTVCTNANPTPVNNAAGQPTTSTGVTTATGQGTGTAAATATAVATRYSTTAGPSWISSHYGWVIFVVIMVLLVIAAVIFGCWYKKRRARKHLNEPRFRSSMAVANEAAASLRNKHPIASPTLGNSPRIQSTQSLPTEQQRLSMGNRPPSSSWQGGAAGVGIAGLHRGASNRTSTVSLPQRESLAAQARTDFAPSPISTPGALEGDAPTPLSIADRPLLGGSAAGAARDTTSPLPVARRLSGKVQKSASTRRSLGPGSTL